MKQNRHHTHLSFNWKKKSRLPLSSSHPHSSVKTEFLRSQIPISTPISLPCLQLTLAVAQAAAVILFTLGLPKTIIEDVRMYLLYLLLLHIATELPGNKKV